MSQNLKFGPNMGLNIPAPLSGRVGRFFLLEREIVMTTAVQWNDASMLHFVKCFLCNNMYTWYSCMIWYRFHMAIMLQLNYLTYFRFCYCVHKFIMVWHLSYLKFRWRRGISLRGWEVISARNGEKSGNFFSKVWTQILIKIFCYNVNA